MLQRLIVVCGPTASGKTLRAIEIAKANNGEIICADSMQIYKDMPICTASPTALEMQGVPHHLFNFVDISETFTVKKYASLAHEKIEEIICRGRLPILVGGTGLYIDTVARNRSLQNIDVPKQVSLDLESKTNEELLEELKRIDKASADIIPLQNRRRLIRALEIYYATGRSKTEIDEDSEKNPKYNTIYVGTYFEKEQLVRRIEKRVNTMLENGLIDEIKKVYSSGNISHTARQSIGCKELFPYFAGEINLETAALNIIKATKNYAKRQMTWFGRNKEIIWLNQSGK